jgi:hypothetical protein
MGRTRTTSQGRKAGRASNRWATPDKPAQTGLCLKHPDRQSQEGQSGREAGRSLPGHALKGEPRERARLKDTGEILRGEKRRGTW